MAVIVGDQFDNSLFGTPEIDEIYGLEGNDRLRGQGGADTLYGGPGDDIFFVVDPETLIVEMPGEGTDTVRTVVDYFLPDDAEIEFMLADLATEGVTMRGNAFDNQISGSDYADAIGGGDGNDRLFGGRGNDFLLGGEGVDFLDGGDGNDRLVGSGNDELRGGNGNDTYFYTTGDFLNTYPDDPAATNSSLMYTSTNVIKGFSTGVTQIRVQGNDPVVIDARIRDPDAPLRYLIGAKSIIGNDADNVIGVGELTRDDSRVLIRGRGGNDDITGGAGPDRLFGNDGDDTIHGFWGDDIAKGGRGTDTIYGNLGDDILVGEAGNDILYGEEQNDALYGGAGDDQLFGGDSNDILNGGTGADLMVGGRGKDTYYVNDPGDVVDASDDNGPTDTVYTNVDWEAGADGKIAQIIVTARVGRTVGGSDTGNVMFGGVGDDTLSGYGGTDILDGGLGDDTLTGGADNDRFVFDALGWGNDVITDYSSAEGDRVAIEHVGRDEFMARMTSDTSGPEGSLLVSYGGETITFFGFTDVSQVMFVFPDNPT